jgi:hypothetical protein
MFKSFILLGVIFSYTSCVQKTFFDNNKNLSPYKCNKIIIENADKSKIVIANKNAIHNFILEINNAKIASKWKGTGWGKIEFVYPDSTYTLNTLDKVFNDPNTGCFYYFNKSLQPYFK